MSEANAAAFDPSNSSASEQTGPFDDLLDEATGRLSGDRELQREVRQELRAHLDDAVAERIAAGIAPAEAKKEARAALGDVAELSSQLFKTHERRLRIRRTLKWSFAAALIPLALLVLFVVARGAVLSLAVGSQLLPDGFRNQNPWRDAAERFSNRAFDRQIAGLSADDRLVVCAVFRGEVEWRLDDRVIPAKQLSDRWPDNPVYYGHYVQQHFQAVTVARPALWKLDPAVAKTLMQEIERGEALDPDNGFYDVLRADLMFLASCTSKVATIPPPTMPGQNFQSNNLLALDLDDPATFQKGLNEWKKSWIKPRFTDYSAEIAIEARRKLPRAENMNALLLQAQPFEPALASLECAMICSSYALTEASKDPKTANADELMGWLEGTLHVTGRLASGKGPLWSNLFVSRVQAYRFATLTALGRTEAADAAKAAWFDHETVVRWYFGQPNTKDQLAGWVIQVGAATDTAERRQFERAEYAVADRAAISSFIGILAVLAALLLLLAGAGSLFDVLGPRRAAGRPTLPRFVFIGWRRLAWVCGIAVLVPLALHTVWTRFSPMGHRDQNLWANWVRLVIEYLILAATILLLLWRLTYVAVRRRGEELGLINPSPVRHWPNIVLALVAIGFNLVAEVIVLGVYGASVDRPGGPRNENMLLHWIWIPCLTPLCWIAVGMAWCAAARRDRARMYLAWTVVIVIAIELIAGLLLYGLGNHGAPLLLSDLGILIPNSKFFLVIVSSLLTPMVLLMTFSPGENLQFARLDCLLIPSALPVIGSAILLLALVGGWPLHHAECSAIRDMGTIASEVGPQE